MAEMLSGTPLFLLQVPQITDFIWEEDPMQVKIVLIALAAIIAIAIVVNILRNGIGTEGKGIMQMTPRKFNAFTLFRIASSYGLDREQTKTLEYVLRNSAVDNPERVMNNIALMDRHFKRAYRAIEKNSSTDEEAQERLAKLFSLRNVIEVAADPGSASPPRLSENTPAVLIVEKDNYHVKVLSARGNNVVTEVPRSPLGSPARIGKGKNVTLSFFTKSSEGFSLSGHVAGYLETDRGSGLQITHTGKLKPLVKRMYRRKQVSIRCDIFIVHLSEPEGKKKPPRLILDSRKFAGTVLDISAGGCAIKTSASIQAGLRLKISIDYDDGQFIHVLGQVLRTNRSGTAGTILHIKFLKIPRRAFNSINAMVYEYDDIYSR